MLRKNTKTFGIIFFRISTHQLHAQANTKCWLCESGNERIQTQFAETLHGRTRLAYAGKDDFICLANRVDILRECSLYAQSPHSE